MKAQLAGEDLLGVARYSADGDENRSVWRKPNQGIGRGDQDGRVSANGSLLYAPRRKIWNLEIWF